MAHMYDTNSALRVPLDGRFWATLLWLLAFVLLGVDTVDNRRFGIIGAWGLIVAAISTTWSCVVLHAYSRRILLDVMSFEHRQQMLATRPPGEVTAIR